MLLILLALLGCESQQSDSAGRPPDPPGIESGTSVDLLKRIQLPRDAVKGGFRLAGGQLWTPSLMAAQLELPVEPPKSYRLEIIAQRMSGSDSLNIGLVVDGHAVMLVLDGWGKPASGLNMVDGRIGDNNVTTYDRPVFKAGKQTTIVCTVEDQSVIAIADGNEIIEFSGNPSRFKLDQRFWKVRTPNRLTIGAWQSEFRITKLHLESLDGDIVPAAPAGTALAKGQPDIRPPTPPTQRPSTSPPNDGWSTFTERRYGFEVRMPGQPDGQNHEDGYYYMHATEDGAYFVTISEVDPRNVRQPEFLDQIWKQVFTEHRIARNRAITLTGADRGKEVVAIDQENDATVVRYYLAGSRMYQVLYSGPATRVDAAETIKFLDSFKLLR